MVLYHPENEGEWVQVPISWFLTFNINKILQSNFKTSNLEFKSA